MKFVTTTSEGVEGHNISYGDELRCAESFKEVKPDWEIHFSWAQILFSDVQYKIDKKKKIVDIVYNQNLRYWWKDMLKAIKKELKVT